MKSIYLGKATRMGQRTDYLTSRCASVYSFAFDWELGAIYHEYDDDLTHYTSHLRSMTCSPRVAVDSLQLAAIPLRNPNNQLTKLTPLLHLLKQTLHALEVTQPLYYARNYRYDLLLADERDHVTELLP